MGGNMLHSWTLAILAASISSAVAQTCISLSGSTACPAFSGASISASNSYILSLYPFLQSVSTLQEFDANLTQYVTQGYVEEHYSIYFGCDDINLDNTTDYYARYTTTFLCNGIVQNTLNQRLCSLTADEAVPLCADSCGLFAESEGEIVNSTLCSGKRSDWLSQLRNDYTLCAEPQNSLLNDTCVTAAQNEPDDCGFANNMVGLCNYCRAGGVNDTDSCCIASNTENRCQGVNLLYTAVSGILPTSTSSTGQSTSRTSSSSSSSAAATAGASSHHHLSGGAIAGIVIGSVAGFILLLALIVFACIAYRKRRDRGSRATSLNQPSPPRQIGSGGSMIQKPPSAPNPNFTILPGNGRITRLSAMQSDAESTEGGYGVVHNPYEHTPGGQTKVPGVLGAIRTSPRGNGSSGGSQDFSSPDGVGSGQSEQFPFFRDYYSNDDIHPNDRVSVLWAYQPRAGDEFELERGDMLKVVGIWDDGWATGVRISDRAEDYDGKGKPNRDSGVSNGSGRRSESPPVGEIKAFPLVCVCLPEVWRKTVEGDSSTDSGSVPI